MISESEIRKLKENIDKQLDNSPLNKKMKASEIYNDKSQKANKVNYIMQTSSIVPSNLNPRKKSNSVQKEKQQQSAPLNSSKKEISAVSIVAAKSEQQKKQQQRTFLISQNKTLKQQTISLIQQLKAILGEIKPKKYGINLVTEEVSPQEKVKKATIASQMAKITYLQGKIAYEQRQLSFVHDYENIFAQQAQVKILQTELQKLQKQKKGVLNILREQTKGIEQIQMSPEFRQKFTKTKDQLEKIKQECKILQNKTLQNERLLRKKHQKTVGHHTKLKKLQKMIQENNEKMKKGKENEKVVSLQMIAQIQEQISELQSEREISQKSWTSKLVNIEAELHSRKLEEQKKILILKDKQREVRLNDLKVKQLKKLFTSQIEQKRKASVSGDEKDNHNVKLQGRVRNIKFMENKQKPNQ